MGHTKQAFHESLKALRELNGGQFPVIRLGLWARVAVSALAPGDPSIGLDYLEKAYSLVTEDTAPSVKIDLALNAGTIYEVLNRYDDAIRTYTEAIELAQKSGLRANRNQLHLFRGIEAVEAGNFVLGLSDLRMAYEEASKIRDTTTEEHAFYAYVDLLVDVGASREADRLWENAERYAKGTKNVRHKVRHALIRGMIDEGQGNYERAVKLRYEAAKLLSQIEDAPGQGYALFRALQTEAKEELRPIDEIVRDFKEFAKQKKRIRSPRWNYQLQVTAYDLAACGGKPVPGPDPDFDPLDCPIAYVMQYLAVAKIRWLDSAGKKDEADKLREDYERVRMEMAERIPHDYREGFLNHPLWRVPG